MQSELSATNLLPLEHQRKDFSLPAVLERPMAKQNGNGRKKTIGLEFWNVSDPVPLQFHILNTIVKVFLVRVVTLDNQSQIALTQGHFVGLTCAAEELSSLFSSTTHPSSSFATDVFLRK